MPFLCSFVPVFLFFLFSLLGVHTIRLAELLLMFTVVYPAADPLIILILV